jgi:ubiquinone/menaquinone biosynthesis C-methylase UbiE
MESIVTDQYALGSDQSERARLLAQCELHRNEATQLIDLVRVAPGDRALDVGCGPLGVLDILSARVGPAGRVVGLDSEPRMLAYAEQSISERELINVELVAADAIRSGLPDDWFDGVHERLVLINHPSPEEIVHEMVRVTQPGGWVALQELDCYSWICEPGHPAWDHLLDTLMQAWSGHLFIGRRLPALLRQAGLSNVDCAAHAYHWPPGHPYRTVLLTFIDIYRSRILEAGMLAEKQLDRLARDLRTHLDAPDTLVVHPLFFQAWGRKPA